MSTPMTCAEFEELCGELVLDTAPGDERAAALLHVARCASCRKLLEAMTEVVDGVLLLGPTAEPPAGFEERTLDRLAALGAAPGVPAPAAPPQRARRRLTLALAAAVLCAVLAAGGWFLTSGGGGGHKGAVLTASMVDASGHVVGRVDLGRQPSTVFVALPGWAPTWSDGGTPEAYKLQVTLAGGRTADLGPVSLPAGREIWGTVVSFDASEVRRVALESGTGQVLCQAILPS